MAAISSAPIPHPPAQVLPPSQLFTCKVTASRNLERVEHIVAKWLELADESRQIPNLAPGAKREREKSYETIRQIGLSISTDLNWDEEIEEILQTSGRRDLLDSLQESLIETATEIVAQADYCEVIKNEIGTQLKRFWESLLIACKNGSNAYVQPYQALLGYLQAVNRSETYIAYDSALKVQGIAIQMLSSCRRPNCATCRDKPLQLMLVATHPENIAAPEKKVRGVGTALIHHIVHDMKVERTAPIMSLRALQTTIPFYKKIGLSVVPNAPEEGELGDDAHPLVRNEYANGSAMVLRAAAVDDFLKRHAGIAKLVDRELNLALSDKV